MNSFIIYAHNIENTLSQTHRKTYLITAALLLSGLHIVPIRFSV